MRLLQIMVIMTCFLDQFAVAQEADNQVIGKYASDSIDARQLDSIQQSAAREFGSLKYQYDSINNIGNQTATLLQHQIDSLDQIHMPTDKLMAKLDSVYAWKADKLGVVTDETSKLKAKTIDKIGKLDLPPELDLRVQRFTSQVNGYDITESIPSAGLGNLNLGLNGPGLDHNLPGISNSSLPHGELPAEVTGISGKFLPSRAKFL